MAAEQISTVVLAVSVVASTLVYIYKGNIDRIAEVPLRWIAIKEYEEIKFQQAWNSILYSIIYLLKYLYKIYCSRGENPFDSYICGSQESSHIGECSLHFLRRIRWYLQCVERNSITVLAHRSNQEFVYFM